MWFPRSGVASGWLLLAAAACVPGEGPRPPSEVLPPIIAGAGFPGASGTSAPPPAGVAGAGPGPVAGRQGLPPVGGGAVPLGGTGGVAGVGAPPLAAAGTGGAAPLPDGGGLPGFDPGTDPNRNLVQPGAICDRLTTLQCAAEAFCCSNPGRTTAVCKADLLMQCGTDLLLDDIAKNTAAGYSMAQAKAALDRLEQLAATCDPSVTLWSLSPEGFRGIFQGTVAPGGECRPTGLPSPAKFGAMLAACTQPATHACLFVGSGPPTSPTSAMCVPRGPAGAGCFLDTNCQDGLYCANPANTYSTGTCTAGRAVGAACSAGNECATQVCKSGACVATTADSAYCLKP